MALVTFNEEYLLEGLGELADIPEMKERLEGLKNFEISLGWFLGLFELIKTAIIAVQKLTVEAEAIGQGRTKKKAVIKWLDKVIELPFFIDKILDVDGKVISMIIDFLVNLIKKIPEEILSE